MLMDKLWIVLLSRLLWKTFLPNQIIPELTDFPDVLNLAFVLLLELPLSVSSPFKY